MKRTYTDPDFEIVNIRLVADILASSTETTYPDHGGGDMDNDLGNGDF